MKINHILVSLSFILISSCSNEVVEQREIPKTSKVEKLIEHSKEFEKKVYSYETPGGKIHIAVGFGIANSIMIEGEGGNIIVDSADSTFEAAQIYTLFKEINPNPIKAIIYTHNHGDHTFGAAHYLSTQKERPKIIAHETTDYYMQRILGIINPIIGSRSARMFGTQLPENELINVGIGKSLSVAKSPLGYVKPDTTFDKELKMKIAGINIELYHAPGETNDQIFIWLPDHNSLMPGDNIYKTFPNLYTIRGTTHRDVMGWVNSLDHMRSFNPEFLFPSHTKPLSGDQVMDALTIYRDAIQFVHDQTIRLMNEGYYPDQIVEMIDLPKEIKESPFLYEFYGTVRWSVKSIFSGYLGWFNGNPSDLDPLSRVEEATRFSNMVGGNENMFAALQQAIQAQDMQWALDHPKVKAIWCARGGYGVTRIIDDLDFTLFLNKPKWLIGYSDITVLHAHLNKLRVASIHGMMGVNLDRESTDLDVSKATLKKVLFGKDLKYKFPKNTNNKGTKAKGELIGGNLTLLQNLLGSESLPNTKDKLIFIEEIKKVTKFT